MIHALLLSVPLQNMREQSVPEREAVVRVRLIRSSKPPDSAQVAADTLRKESGGTLPASVLGESGPHALPEDHASPVVPKQPEAVPASPVPVVTEAAQPTASGRAPSRARRVVAEQTLPRGSASESIRSRDGRARLRALLGSVPDVVGDLVGEAEPDPNGVFDPRFRKRLNKARRERRAYEEVRRATAERPLIADLGFVGDRRRVRIGDDCWLLPEPGEHRSWDNHIPMREVSVSCAPREHLHFEID